MYHGILILDKPSGMTSHDVVNRVRRIFRTKRVGHTGTLDPEATGVMVVCIGNGLRVAEYLSAAQKQYVAEITFGIEADTQDIWGTVTAIYDASALSEADLFGSLVRFRGTIYQVPPMVSARRFEGKHLYELARKGVTVEREARPVEILELEISKFVPGARPTVELTVTCSTGTYIRTLAYDIGRSLGIGAVMSALRRTRVGTVADAFKLDQAHTLDELAAIAENRPQQLEKTLLPSAFAVSGWPRATIDDAQQARIRNGQTLSQDETGTVGEPRSDALIALLDQSGELVAIARIIEEQTVQPVKVMQRD